MDHNPLSFLKDLSIEAIIFDCDGVLVDSEHLKFLSWQQALAEYGVEFVLEDYLPLIGLSSKHILRGINTHKKTAVPEEVIARRKAIYAALQKTHVIPIPLLVSFAQQLSLQKSSLNFKLGLASSASHEEISINLEAIALKDAFDLILSGTDDLHHYRDPEGTNKPKPYIYLEMAKKLSLTPSSCLVFEDTTAGVVSAKNAGMIPIAIPNSLTQQHDFSEANATLNPFSPAHVNVFFNHLTKRMMYEIT